MRGRALLLAAAWSALASPAGACFGTHLRVVSPGPAAPAKALAAFAAGYFIQEKTGVEPEFVDATEVALLENRADLALAAADLRPPRGVVTRPAGPVPGLGPCLWWLRADVLDDLRFTTVDRALAKLPAFFGSAAYREALQSSAPPKKAARKAVLDGT